YPGIRKVLKEPGGGLTGEFGTKASAVPFGPLPITAVGVFRLVKSRAETSGEKRHWIERVLDEQSEFIFKLESAHFHAGLIVRGVNRLAFQRPGERAHDLLQGPVVVSQPYHRRRLNARLRHILHGFFLQKRR